MVLVSTQGVSVVPVEKIRYFVLMQFFRVGQSGIFPLLVLKSWAKQTKYKQLLKSAIICHVQDLWNVMDSFKGWVQCSDTFLLRKSGVQTQ